MSAVHMMVFYFPTFFLHFFKEKILLKLQLKRWTWNINIVLKAKFSKGIHPAKETQVNNEIRAKLESSSCWEKSLIDLGIWA